jgi:hypothetical protein
MSRIRGWPPRGKSGGSSGAKDVASQSSAAGAAEYSHLSVEVGRFSVRDVADDQALVSHRCRRAGGWLAAVEASAETGGSILRSSTCVLLDDYSSHNTKPAPILDALLAASRETGLRIDYIARLGGLASGADAAPVDLVAARLVEEPPPGTNGTRPPFQETGWFSNGRRSPDGEAAEAMSRRSWAPPKEFAAVGHSIFLDVELWRDDGESAASALQPGRVWSPAMLTASWLLLRLGQLRSLSAPAVVPEVRAPGAKWPSSWDDVPAVVKVNADASPLAAYQAVSIAPHADLAFEHAVRLILDSVVVDQEAFAVMETQAAVEGLTLASEVSDRLCRVLYMPGI